MPLEDRLDDGWSIRITFADFPDVEFWFKEVGMPGYSMGGAILTSTMENEVVHTKSPKGLIDVPDTMTKVSFSSEAFNATGGVRPMMGKNNLATYKLPDGAEYDVYSFIDEFLPDPFVYGEQPTANLKIIHTNTHPITKVETLPVFRSAP